MKLSGALAYPRASNPIDLPYLCGRLSDCDLNRSQLIDGYFDENEKLESERPNPRGIGCHVSSGTA